MLKMDFLAYFSKNLTNPAINFCAFGRKTLFAGNFLEIFRKFAKVFSRKLRKCIILAYLSKNFANTAFNFCAFGRKTTLFV